MHDPFDHDALHEDDPATMVSELRGRLDRKTLARALGVEPDEVDLIAAGYTPSAGAAERLRLLYRMASKTDDLRDPRKLLAAVGMEDMGDDERRAFALAVVPSLKTYLVAFLILDAVIFGAVVAIILLR